MIRDRYLRIFFIPLLGIVIPLVSGIITYPAYTIVEIIAANIYFIVTSFFIWMGSNWVHAKLRGYFKVGANPFPKIASLCALSVLYGVSAGSISTMIWFYIFTVGKGLKTICMVTNSYIKSICPSC